ncbi:hypothetical protein AMTR_s00486p00010130 [Amborella trichopoda]|uniref:Plant heme peroxidase family profile domain-containing protein n=1 Tax=Amborella trichopoda TaxID=13333 RepID=W1NQ10_AMBTC|nr:hypothetical protein AMTR_s00486p00010130 [Amborella trichopoda]
MGLNSTAALALVIVLVCSSSMCYGHLSSNFYHSSCPHALSTIRSKIRSAISAERRMGASLIRLHFHDCFVNVSDEFQFFIFVSVRERDVLLRIPAITQP